MPGAGTQYRRGTRSATWQAYAVMDLSREELEEQVRLANTRLNMDVQDTPVLPPAPTSAGDIPVSSVFYNQKP